MLSDTVDRQTDVAGATDIGYFPPGESLLREVHEHRLVGLFYGQRALCIGALAPLNYVGTSRHTRGKLAPFRRLTGTGNAFEKIYFGTRSEADRVLAHVHRLHDTVKGELPEAAGPFPEGTPYSAYDPALMLWTVALIADSALYFQELFVRRLSPAKRDALWQEYIRFGELFGMPREVAPSTYAEFREYFDGTLAGPGMHLTDEARHIGHATAFQIPMPLHAQGAKRVHDLVMLGSLPQRVREIYGLPWSAGREQAFRVAVATIKTGGAVAPRRLTRGWNRASFDMVERTERRRLEQGKPTPQVIG